MKPSVGRRFLNTYFAASLDLRVQAFNLLAFAGMAAGVITALSALFTGAGLANVTLNLSGTAVGFLCLRYARRTNRYRAGFLVSVVAVFVILFPLLFFSAGGYRSGMPCFFIFALIFTAIMLEGKTRTAFIILEFALYAACFFIAFYFPGAVRHFETRFDYMFDALTGVVVVGAILVIIVLLYMRIYDSRQKRLHELNKLKTEFLQDIGHEVRNPLQVIAYGVDFMRSSMGTEGGTEEMHNALNIIQDKAVRLGLMINGMVDLATMSGDPASRAKADFAAMLRQSVEDVRPEAERKHNALRVEIAPDLPQVYAVPEQLARVPVNLLQNAMNATAGGEISLAATFADGYITVKIRDSGTGIDPELLPRVFERGVSGGDGKGYGLAICKTIIEAHGGAIDIESKKGWGATATFTVPLYGGQGE